MKRAQIVAVIVCFLSWVLASPLGSASDDNFHLASTWCSHGFRQGICEESAVDGYKLLPTPIANAGKCYLGDSEKSASCTNLEISEFKTQLTPTDRVAEDGIIRGEQSIFYWINGFFASTNFELSILLMRMFNCAILLALLFLATKAHRSEESLKMMVVTLSISVPVFLWTVSSNNSSSWTFLGTLFSWFFIDALLSDSKQSRKRFAVIGFFLTIILATGSRSETLPLLMIQVLAFVALRYRSFNNVKIKSWLVLAVVLLLSFLGYFLYISGLSTMFTNAFAYVRDDSPLVRDSSWVFLYNIQATLTLYYWLISAIGVLNSSDLELFGSVGILNSIVLSIVVFESLRKATKRTQVLLLMIVATAFVVPLILLQGNNLLVGEELQSRYLFPIFSLFIGFAVLQNLQPLRFGVQQARFLAVCISIVHLIVLRQVILRFTVGIEHYGVFNLDQNPEWWWADILVPSPMITWLAGSVSFGFLAFTIFDKTTSSGI